MLIILLGNEKDVTNLTTVTNHTTALMVHEILFFLCIEIELLS